MLDVSEGTPTYKLIAWCSECEWEGKIKLSRGQLIPCFPDAVQDGSMAECPRCGLNRVGTSKRGRAIKQERKHRPTPRKRTLFATLSESAGRFLRGLGGGHIG